MKNKKINLTLDGTAITVDEGTTVMEAADGLGHPHPAAVLPSRPEPGRLVPRVHRRREGDGLLHGLVQLRGVGGHGGRDQLARNPPGPTRHRRADPRQPPQGLPDLRARRQLRAAEPGLFDGRPRAALRGPAQAVPDRGIEPLGRPRRQQVHPLRPVRSRLRRDPGRVRT